MYFTVSKVFPDLVTKPKTGKLMWARTFTQSWSTTSRCSSASPSKPTKTTLVCDDTAWDRFNMRCGNYHRSSALTDASVPQVKVLSDAEAKKSAGIPGRSVPILVQDSVCSTYNKDSAGNLIPMNRQLAFARDWWLRRHVHGVFVSDDLYKRS